ncbi:MAG: hypothetical protein KIT16_08295 [Rhodospirillaceae bacterium]|nr:hypothetical protein [Rhodospirillaceae bacterium]
MSGFKERSIAAQERFSRPDRLGDLAAHGGRIFCWCNRCAHHARLDGRQLSLALGPDFPVPEVGAKLRCSNCGAKDVATRADFAPAPPAAVLDLPACA